MGSTVKSLKAQQHVLSDADKQLEFLNNGVFERNDLPKFGERIATCGFDGLKSSKIEIFQVNVGYMCNQTCKHCHVDAGPDRKEIMTRGTMQQCIDALKTSNIKTLDLTGGAPEMNPDFRWFVEEANNAGVQEIIVRSNLTIITANKKYYDLPDFFKANNVHVVSSLPYFNAKRTDSQRGEGVFEKSIKALHMLNSVGYGEEGSGLQLDLVYNPAGAFLPGDQSALELQFKKVLKEEYDIDFNSLFAITNLPISRFLDYLIASGNYEDYMERLVDAFNPAVVEGVMCRNTVSISWDGLLYDCDFNQMLGLSVNSGSPKHVKDWDQKVLEERKIVIDQHCYGCTAGAGSSCQGTTI